MEEIRILIAIHNRHSNSSVTVNKTGCGFDYHWRNFFISSPDIEAKSGVVLRHSTRNASRVQKKMDNKVS